MSPSSTTSITTLSLTRIVSAQMSRPEVVMLPLKMTVSLNGSSSGTGASVPTMGSRLP
jgi:hypothetical protein